MHISSRRIGVEPVDALTLAALTLSGSPAFGRLVGNSNTCLSWTQGNTSYTGPFIQAGGAMYTGGTCNTVRRISCCY